MSSYSNSSNLHFFNTTTEDYTYLLYEATPTNCAVVCEAYTVQMHIPINGEANNFKMELFNDIHEGSGGC